MAVSSSVRSVLTRQIEVIVHVIALRPGSSEPDALAEMSTAQLRHPLTHRLSGSDLLDCFHFSLRPHRVAAHPHPGGQGVRQQQHSGGHLTHQGRKVAGLPNPRAMGVGLSEMALS